MSVRTWGNPLPSILRFPQHQIDNPAAADVRPWRMAMLKNVGIGAAGFLQRVGQNRQQIEAAVRYIYQDTSSLTPQSLPAIVGVRCSLLQPSQIGGGVA